MSEEAPTPWDLHRQLKDMREDMRAGFGGIHARIDKVVTSEMFALAQAAHERRMAEAERDIAALQERREAAEAERRVDMRWRIGLAIGVAAPILWTLFETSRGAVS